jgi:hypothetical protein
MTLDLELTLFHCWLSGGAPIALCARVLFSVALYARMLCSVALCARVLCSVAKGVPTAKDINYEYDLLEKTSLIQYVHNVIHNLWIFISRGNIG